MGIFNSVGKILKKESSDESSYLSLTLTPDNVLSSVWEFGQAEIVKTIGFAKKDFKSPDILVHEAAIAIDKSAEHAKNDVSKVVFGLSQAWMESNDLTDETAKLLKQLTEDLELDAQAFISIGSAINHYLKIEESITPFAITIGLFENFCEVGLLEQNKVQKSANTKGEIKKEQIIDLVKKMKSEGRELPSRIIAFGQEEKSKLAKELESIDWKELFIHPPKITYLTDEELSKAIAYSQAADVLGHEPQKLGAAILADQEKPELESVEKTSKVSELGFIEGEDVLENSPEELEKSPEPLEESNVESINVPKDSQEESELREVPKPDDSKPEPSEAHHKSNRQFKIFGVLSQLKEKIINLSWIPSFSFFKKTSSKNLLIGVAAVALVLVAGLYFLLKTITTVTVIIHANGQNTEKDFKVTAQVGANADANSSQIGAQEQTATADGSQKVVATGNKKIGQKASGQVNIFNWTTSPKTFSSGTVLISKNGVKFSLGTDADVASRSASTPGQSQANVNAVEFGDSGNIGANTDFTFQQYDELLFSARNDNAFTGGNEKQVTVVSQDDLTKLEKALTDTLTSQAKSSLKDKSNGADIGDSQIIIKVLKKEFDKKLDEEASLVNLNMQIEASALIFSDSELKDTLAQIIKPQIDQNLDITAENIEIANQTVKRKDTTLTISGNLNAKLLPKINEDELKKKIAGKSSKDTRAIIQSQSSDVSDVEIKFTPQLPIISQVPANASKIKFQLIAN